MIAPDLWKKHTPTEIEYLQFFNDCEGAPSYEQVQLLCSTEHGGTHFGSNFIDTYHAGFKFLSYLFERGQFEADNLFFKGYVHHLRVDKNFYENSSIFDRTLFVKDLDIDKKTAIADLHQDWDKTNFTISSWYPEIINVMYNMPEKVQKVIGFADGNTKYVNLTPMKQFIKDMRKPRSMNELLNG